jgi:RNA polymerase sigma-70 factor (ECF subfamily)
VVDQNLTLFNEIYDQTYDKVLRYVISKCGNTNDIADIVQETYLELYQTIVKRGASYIKNPGAFVLQLAKAKVYKHYSLMEKLKRILPRVTLGREDAPPAPEEVQVHEAFVNSATVREIWTLLQGQDQQVQKIFYLYYYCGLKLREISRELDLHESTVKHKLYRTLAELRKFYREEAN